MKRFFKSAISSGALVLAFVLATGLSAHASSNTSINKKPTDMKSRISVMTFNVENFFDTVDDADRDDETFLPLAYKKAHPEVMAKCDQMSNDYFKQECRDTDWSEQVFETKMTRIAEVVRNVNAGRGPDILSVVEVENINALTQLNERKLKDLGYQTVVLIEGPDTRGIDPGLLSRFPQWDKAQLHIVPYVNDKGQPDKQGARSRGILEVRLLLPDGTKVAYFVGHFPSQSNPSYLRKQAIAELNRLKANLPKDVVAIAGGDFNITAEEDLTTGYISKDLANNWLVSNIVGCKDCKGTEVYKRTWSFLDILAFSPLLDESRGTSAWALDTASITVPAPVRDHVNKFGEPQRFEPPSLGVSDHWPVYAELYKR